MKYLHILDFVESFYILYMFFLFKTKHSFRSPLEYTHVSDYMYHPTTSETYDNKICRFGKDVSIILALWIIFGQYYFNKISIMLPNYIIFLIVLIFSIFMNMNAFVYILPVFIYECIKELYLKK